MLSEEERRRITHQAIQQALDRACSQADGVVEPRPILWTRDDRLLLKQYKIASD